jgi:hypothetical protein
MDQVPLEEEFELGRTPESDLAMYHDNEKALKAKVGIIRQTITYRRNKVRLGLEKAAGILGRVVGNRERPKQRVGAPTAAELAQADPVFARKRLAVVRQTIKYRRNRVRLGLEKAAGILGRVVGHVEEPKQQEQRPLEQPLPAVDAAAVQQQVPPLAAVAHQQLAVPARKRKRPAGKVGHKGKK